ncbi:MAG: PAS-domain containing protein [Proteobacteria bacterium]|nr:PAS-domain containing protein [Pseudomonadota bacterium]
MPVWRRDGALALVACNTAFADAVEAEPARVIAEGRMLGGNALAERGGVLAERARKAGVPHSESHHVVVAGSRRLLNFTEIPLPDGGTIGIASDETAREEAQTELTRHIAAHADVLENLATAIAIYGADRRLKFFNTAFSKLWTLDEKWLRQGPDYGEVLEALRERRRLQEYADFPAFKRRSLKMFTSLVEPLEEWIYVPDGTTLRTRIMPHPMGGLLFTFEDVTDTLVLERTLNTQIAVQRDTLNNLYEGVVVVGSDGRLKLSNPAYGRIWGLPQESLAAEPHIADIIERVREYFDYDEDWSALKERIIGRLTGRSPRAGRLHRTDGSVLDYACVPLPDGAMLLSYLDVTDSFRVERALRERTDALEAADRLKSEFISTISYELRTPLTTIIGFAEILANQYFGPLNDRQREYCAGIIGSSQRLLSIINDILDLSSIEAGRMSLELRAVEPRALLTDVVAIMGEMARKGELQLAMNCPLELGEIVIDERRMKQALCNLVSNAIKFTPPGGSVTLSVELHEGWVKFAVSDTGIGIAEEDQTRVFEAFVRGRKGKGSRTGAGLGLPLVKRIVELHNGRVEISSPTSRGTTVVCILPLQAALAAESQQQAAAGDPVPSLPRNS